MINISPELKQMYCTDGNIKHISISVRNTDTVLTNSDIQSEDFTLTEILSSEEQICYGLCNASKVEFSCINCESITEDSTLDISLTVNDSTETLPLGTFIVDSAKKQSSKNIKKVVAYDRIYSIDDIDMIAFYDSLTFPMTLRALRESFFSYAGINCASVNLLNDNLTVNADNDFRDLSGREFLQAICELNAVFGKMSRQDVFTFIDISSPSSYSVNGYPLRTIESENYETKRITRIKIIDGGGAVLYNYGSDNEANYYNIKGNFLLKGRTSADSVLQNTVNTLYQKMNSLYYTPCKATAKGLPFLETGDLLNITKDGQAVRTYILSRTLKGIIAMTDTYEANGVNMLREAYSSETSVSQDVYNSNQNNRINYIVTSNGEPIILPTASTTAVNKKFSCTARSSDFEYMAVVTATVTDGGTLEFRYRLDGDEVQAQVKQTAQNNSYQQVMLYMPFTAHDIGTHQLEVDVISDAVGTIDINHWVSCFKGQNISETDKAVVSLTIIDLPEKLKYAVNEPLDLTGLTVAANYRGGERKILSSDEYTVTADMSSTGTKNAVISYKGNTAIKAEFKIDVMGKIISKWSIESEVFSLPALSSSNLPCIIYWGDGSSNTGFSNAGMNHTYNETGQYTITVLTNSSDIVKYAMQNRADLLEFDCADARIRSIGQYAFENCTSLNKVTLTSALGVTISAYAFHKCTSLTQFPSFGSMPNSIKDYAFSQSGLQTIEITDNIILAGSSQGFEFGGCKQLKTVMFNRESQSMGYYNSFSGCSALTYVKVPTGLKYVRNGEFARCTSLTSIDLPDTLVNLGTRCFAECESLRTIRFGGTKNQWNSVKKANELNFSWNAECEEISVICTDGIITVPAYQ